MIAAKIEGRLGNQLFQYAFIYSAAKHLDTSFYIDQGIEKFKLYDYFEIEKGLFYPLESYLFKISGFKNFFNYHLKKLFYVILKFIFLNKEVMIKDYEQPVEEVLRTLQNKSLYIGFFQSEKYFIEFNSEIKSLFTVKKKYRNHFSTIFNEFKTKKNLVVIHVRRGDYLDLGYAHNSSYYLKAIDTLNLVEPFYVFISDDVEFVEKEFRHIHEKYVSRYNEIIDFQFLINADACILSKSSFSWWGAFLNCKKAKIIVPDTLEHNGLSMKVSSDYTLNSWIRV